jgi:hypothetical protein
LFKGGFIFTAGVLFFLNLASYILLRIRIPSPGAGHVLFGGEAGFPLPFYEYSTGYIIGIDHFNLINLMLNILFLLVVATAMGVFLENLNRKRG